MKKYICLLLVIVLCFGIVGCGDSQQNQSAETTQSTSNSETAASGGQSEADYVFRYANWGDDAETIANREPKPCDYQAEFTLDYNDIELFGYNADASYSFINGGFYGGTYMIDTDLETLEIDFDNVDSFLKNQYGKPKLEKESEWKKVALEADESLSKFDVIYYSLWKEKDVHIIHILHIFDSKTWHDIMYLNPN